MTYLYFFQIRFLLKIQGKFGNGVFSSGAFDGECIKKNIKNK